MQKVCEGCGVSFEARRRDQRKCKKGCNRSLSRKKEYAVRWESEDKGTRFIGVDGEGETRIRYVREEVWSDDEQDMVSRGYDRPVHEYVLLTVGDRALHCNGNKLTHEDIFPFLWDCYQDNPDAAFVGFYLGYDFTYWLQSIDYHAAWRLLTQQGQQKRLNKYGRKWPVRVGEWEIEVLWPKQFKIRPYYKRDEIPTRTVKRRDGTTYEKAIERPFMIINDTGPFFQTSFLKAINPRDWQNPVCTPDQYERIRAGKAARGKTLVFNDEMMAYNAEENVILATMMGVLDSGFRHVGINLGKSVWYGPGSAASAWFDLIHAPSGEEFREVTPIKVREAARNSYYGGWFEIFAHGIVKGVSWGYDINSAYPDIIRKLPCLLHGKWMHGTGEPPKNDHLQLQYIHYEGDDDICGPLPFRDPDGAILRPLTGVGWYWKDEISASFEAGLLEEVEISEWWDYDPCDCRPPLREIEELYFERLRADKKSPHGKAMKLVYNSAYGKTGQSVGSAKWANVVYASLITSGCRSKILRAIGTHPRGTKDLLMVATDGVYFATRHPGLDRSATNERIVREFPKNQHLGEWEVTPHKNLALFLPGIYWDDEARDKIRERMRILEEFKDRPEDMPELPGVKMKTRGIGSNDLAAYVFEVERQWAQGIKFPSVVVPTNFAIIGAKIAAHRRDWPTCGQLMMDQGKRLDAGSNDVKRDLDSNQRINGALRSYPYEECESTLITYGYSKSFGDPDLPVDNVIPTEAEVLAAMEEVPTDFYTQDGPIGINLGEALFSE